MNRALIISRALLQTSFAGFLILSAPQLVAADRLTTGQYESTVTTDGKTRTFKYCFTLDEAKVVNADTKVGRRYTEESVKGACTVSAYDATGDTVTSTLTCGASVSTIKATYHGDWYESDTTRTSKGSAHSVHTKGKRLGPCR
jgi:hypothetical protein